MSRFLAIILLIAALMLGAGGHASKAGSSISGSEIAVTGLENSHMAGGQGDVAKVVPSQGCHHLGCSSTFAAPATTSAFHLDGLSAAGPVVDKCDKRSAILKRDPPIPRFLV